MDSFNCFLELMLNFELSDEGEFFGIILKLSEGCLFFGKVGWSVVIIVLILKFFGILIWYLGLLNCKIFVFLLRIFMEMGIMFCNCGLLLFFISI